MARALIVYHTKTGHTRQAGEDIAAGLAEKGVEAALKGVAEVSAEELSAYDVVVVGSPCHAGSVKVMFSGIARPVSRWLGGLAADAFVGTSVAAYSVYSRFGGLSTVKSLERLLADMGGRVLKPGPAVKAGVPLSLWRGPDASPEDRERLRQFGRDLAGEL